MTKRTVMQLPLQKKEFEQCIGRVTMRTCLLGIDIGTSACKIAVFDENGGQR